MTRFTTTLSKAVAHYVRLIQFLAGVSMALIVGIMIAQVFYRYVLGSSLIWAEELCRYLLIWQTFLVLGLVYSRNGFVALEFLPAMLPPRGKWILRAIMAVPIVTFLVAMAWYGYDFASRFDRQTIPALDFIWTALTGDALGVSIKWVYFSVTVGLALMSLHVLADLAVTFRRELIDNDDRSLPDDNEVQA
ncbi:TRAP transporter small permease [Pseudodonghicola flavimaris]|uniref:TRAP transporter small permease protein n=1 Tax=Pseudodonghicola flavimaris TaxID=3050036 RepID=A0ABT7F1Y5_9RHOB|nr:TRAP transporter small permease [Pseudodonghicola flavimaris]MDK3018624.1 TRAP transporter small permease [Pseudodonghicola flavimaris]